MAVLQDEACRNGNGEQNDASKSLATLMLWVEVYGEELKVGPCSVTARVRAVMGQFHGWRHTMYFMEIPVINTVVRPLVSSPSLRSNIALALGGLAI